MNIGEKIRAARQAKGMTQEELGSVLGVQKSAIAKYESGRVVNIKRSTLKKISDILNIPPFELIFDENQKKMMQKNDALTDIVVKLRTDKDFFSLVEGLTHLDKAQLASITQIVAAFQKD